MSRSWWPLRRRSDTSKKPKSTGKQGDEDKRLGETRRIARHVAREAYRAGDDSEPEVEPEPEVPKGPTVTVYGDLVHINYHQDQESLRITFFRRDPITKRLKRAPKNFGKSDVFYTKDGKLLSDETWIG